MDTVLLQAFHPNDVTLGLELVPENDNRCKPMLQCKKAGVSLCLK